MFCGFLTKDGYLGINKRKQVAVVYQLTPSPGFSDVVRDTHEVRHQIAAQRCYVGSLLCDELSKMER